MAERNGAKTCSKSINYYRSQKVNLLARGPMPYRITGGSPGRINSETALKDGTRSMLDSFRDHFDSSAGAFGLAKSAALAIIVIKLEAVTRTQFDDCIVRADAVAVVALETIAA